MYSLTKDMAILLVRKNFDEQKLNDSDMVDTDDIDSNEFEEILVKNLPEAINAVHSMAPLSLLDGKCLTDSELKSVEIEDGVLSFKVEKEILRLIAFQAADSSYVISDAVSEYSAEGRMQLNPYTRGTSDRPRLVLLQGKAGNALKAATESSGSANAESSETATTTSEITSSYFRYYSLDTDTAYSSGQEAQAIKRFEYIPTYRYDKSGTSSYEVADNVIENVISQLTAMMLVIYNNTEKAAYFFTQAGFGQTSPSETSEQN